MFQTSYKVAQQFYKDNPYREPGRRKEKVSIPPVYGFIQLYSSEPKGLQSNVRPGADVWTPKL